MTEKDRLEEIEEKALLLNTRLTRVNEEIARVSRRLKDACVGIEVSIPLGQGAGGLIGYARTREGWALAYKTPGSSWMRLAKAPRKVRLAAAPLLPYLLDMIEDKLEEDLDEA